MISGICPACGTQFYSRRKVIVHACESRQRGKSCSLRCKDVILSGSMQKVPESVFLKLQERDRQLRKKCLQSGNTHVRVAMPAKRVASAAANRAEKIRKLHHAAPVVCNSKRRLNVEDANPGPPKRNNGLFVPQKRVNHKTPVHELVHVLPKRLKRKSPEVLLYRRV